ncbi:MAG: hypothetical protein SGBAC_011170 [Bacillariaceae sp.]
MEAVSLDISTADLFKDLPSFPSTTISSFRMNKDLEYAMQGMEKEVKASPTCLSSNILSSASPFDAPTEGTVDPIWGKRYDAHSSLSPPFSTPKRNLLKNKGKGKTKLSKFAQYSAVAVNNSSKSSKKNKKTIPVSELKLKEVQLIKTLGRFSGTSPNKGVSVIFGDMNPTVEKYSRKNIPIVSIKPTNNNPAEDSTDDNESIDNNSTGTSSTAESSQYGDELTTVLSRIQLATSQPSLSYQFGDDLDDCDLVDAVAKIELSSKPETAIKEYVQQSQADHLLAVQEESLRKAMERQHKKESFFW